jgi:voltage-gated potassium channel Kch
VYAVTSFLFVLASILGFCLETLPDLTEEVNVTRTCGTEVEEENVAIVQSHKWLTILDYICTAFFSVELIVRIIFAPNKKSFFKSAMNLIDMLALLPLYVQIILELADSHNCLRSHRAVLETIFILRIVRIFRIFHLVQHYKALKILVHAIKASIQELLMLSIFLFIAMLVFSTLIFYAERPGHLQEGGDFYAIPVGLWWSIITMTTVGYGDVYPKTALGCVIGAMCALSGVLLVFMLCCIRNVLVIIDLV